MANNKLLPGDRVTVTIHNFARVQRGRIDAVSPSTIAGRDLFHVRLDDGTLTTVSEHAVEGCPQEFRWMCLDCEGEGESVGMFSRQREKASYCFFCGTEGSIVAELI